MPEATHDVTIAAAIDEIWEVVKDMNNWAPLVTGYQRHELIDERNSLWVLKGDVGALSRTVELDIHILEWNGPHRVHFSLKGRNEDVSGDGTFEMHSDIVPSPENDTEQTPKEAPTGHPWWMKIVRWFFHRILSSPKALPLPSSTKMGEMEKPSTQKTKLSFRLKMEAGGPMAPMVNAMLGPALVPATESLAQNIAELFSSTAAADQG